VLAVRQIIESTVTEFRECVRAMGTFAEGR